jgi:Ca2+-binding RTX toxin-like protein
VKRAVQLGMATILFASTALAFHVVPAQAIACTPNQTVLFATQGSDTYDKGTSDNNFCVDMLGGYDTFFGAENTGPHPDTVWGGNGDDFVTLGPGADQADLGANEDYVLGEAGDDEIHMGSNSSTNGDQGLGGQDNDTMYGDGGEDDLTGQSGNDTIQGGDDCDQVWGENGDDNLYANNGCTNGDVDAIFDGNGSDTIHGGPTAWWYPCADNTPDDASGFTGHTAAASTAWCFHP